MANDGKIVAESRKQRGGKERECENIAVLSSPPATTLDIKAEWDARVWQTRWPDPELLALVSR